MREAPSTTCWLVTMYPPWMTKPVPELTSSPAESRFFSSTDRAAGPVVERLQVLRHGGWNREKNGETGEPVERLHGESPVNGREGSLAGGGWNGHG